MKVLVPIDDTPKFHSDIQSGDLIISLNNAFVKCSVLNLRDNLGAS